MSKKAVLVTTDKRGVFFGYLEGEASPEQVTLTQARNCVYWSRQLRGFLGLAEKGPDSECRVGPAVPDITLYGITSVVSCTDAAIEAWEAAPWS